MVREVKYPWSSGADPEKNLTGFQPLIIINGIYKYVYFWVLNMNIREFLTLGLSHCMGTQRCCDVESTSLTLIQHRNNVVCAVGFVIFFYFVRI